MSRTKTKPPAKPPDPKSEGAAPRAAGAEPWENPYPCPSWERMKAMGDDLSDPYFLWLDGYNGGKNDNE